VTAGAHDHDEIRTELANLRVELADVRARAETQGNTAQATTAAAAAETAATSAQVSAYDAQADIARIEGRMTALAEKLETPPEPAPIVVPDLPPLPPLPMEGEGDVPPPAETENKPTKPKKKKGWFD
jgi:hypothetical protein